MAGRFVRASKYREHRHCMHEIKLTWRLGHVFGKSTRKEACYDNLHISRNAWDTNLVKVGHLAFTYLSKKLIANPGKS
jgi:coronin-1B/1C/6